MSDTEGDLPFPGFSAMEQDSQENRNRSDGSETASAIEPTNEASPTSGMDERTAKRPAESDDGSENARETLADEAIPRMPKKKMRVSFDSVNVFYFDREQGSTSVPSEGGSTLGMSAHHSEAIKFSIDEYAIEKYRPRENQQSNNAEKFEPRAENQRYSILKKAGVRVNALEEIECESIRDSRGNCGCDCEEFCEPDTCFCAQAGINCQVDCPNFPCSCTKEQCRNPSGRIEVDLDDIRARVCHTLRGINEEKDPKTE